jgi:DNA-binding transcriptional MerR regulator/methylmalonyl-CoA mutase cobalamin-binding subunit
MNERSPLSISGVERETGIPKETLRVWERRYGFPHPGRDANGERAYPREQVERLRTVKRLLDQGYRPGKLMPMPDDELNALAGKLRRDAPPAPRANAAELDALVELVRRHEMAAVRRAFNQSILQQGLRSFIVDVAAPLTTLIGDAWAAGTVAVFEEHLYTEALQAVLRPAIQAVHGHDAYPRSPRVLLTTIPLERHGLGLLMAEAILALEGAHCIALGVQTPLAEIVAAARLQQADIVALSFSSATSVRATVENLTELRRRLDDAIGLWAGGDGAAAARRHLEPVAVVNLDDLPGLVALWRARHAPATERARA